MANPRFYIDAPDETFEGTVTLPPKAAHHAGRALRLASGERVDLFNGRGKLWSGTIEFTAESTFVHVDRVAPSHDARSELGVARKDGLDR